MHTRGLLDETLVVLMGEFGRTPKVGQVTSNAGAAKANGRDHWPYCYTVLFAGAGVKPGTVYGSSDRIAAYPRENPVGPEDIAATIYDALGIDPATEIHDATNKPYTLCTGKPIRALLG
jgi:arylsulfatase A-like enzyme